MSYLPSLFADPKRLCNRARLVYNHPRGQSVS